MPDDNPIAVPRPHRRHKGRLTVRIGRRSSLRLDVAIDSTGLLAIGGLVSSILLSTAVIVGVVTSGRERARPGTGEDRT